MDINEMTFLQNAKRSAREDSIMLEPKSNADLVDIRDVQVDNALPKHERIIAYVKQIKDPYHFKCGEFTVTAKYADNGVSLEDCLGRIMM
jgi:hypothetical protein